MDHLCYFVLCLSFIRVCSLPAGKGLTPWLLLVMSNCGFVTFPCGILGQVWYLVVLIPHLCRLSYFVNRYLFHISFLFYVQVFHLNALDCLFSLLWEPQGKPYVLPFCIFTLAFIKWQKCHWSSLSRYMEIPKHWY